MRYLSGFVACMGGHERDVALSEKYDSRERVGASSNLGYKDGESDRPTGIL